MARSLEKLIATTTELAALPASVVELLHVLRDPTVGTDKVIGILERDLALTTNLLKLANSVYYGQQRQISSVRQALVVLGNRVLATLAIATGMAPVMRRDLETYQLTKEEFWRHALVTAAASARIVVERGAAEQSSQAFTAGLIHDVGKLLIDGECHLNGLQLAAQGEDCDLCRLENDLLGFDHCDAGGLLAERWGFPAELTLPLRYHHTTPMPPLVGVAGEESAAAQLQIEAVRAGDLIAHYLIRSETEQLAHGAEFPPELVDQGISAELVRDFQLNLTDSFEDLLTSVTAPSA